MGARLTAGQQTLNLLVEVRILCPQPEKILVRGFFVSTTLSIFEENGDKRFLHPERNERGAGWGNPWKGVISFAPA